MSDATLDDVLRRLDALEHRLAGMDDSLARLVAAAERGDPATPGAPAAPSAPRAQTPPEPIGGARDSGDERVRSPSSSAVEEGAPDAPQVEGVGTDADVEQILVRMFEAALEPSDESAYERLASLTHSRDLAAPRALDHLEAFSWRKLRRQVARYVSGGDPASFRVIRTTPTDPGEDATRIKVFVHADGASPAPVTLERDETADGAWRLSQVSL